MWRAGSLERTLRLGKIEGKRRGWQRLRWLEKIIYSMDMNLSKFPGIVRDREAWHAPVHGVSNSCPLSRWCHPTISSSGVPFSCLHCFPAKVSFLMSCIRWPEFWSFSFSISPSNVYTGLISFRIDWFDLLMVILQGTLKSFLQHHSSKASSAFFMVQLSLPYMTIGKTLALTTWTFSAKWCLCILICCLGWP